MVLLPPFQLSFVRTAAGLACALGFAAAWAQPAGLTPLLGNAVVTTAGKVTTVVTTNGAGTNHSAFDWRSFGVPSGTTVFFSQPNAGSFSVNRVLGGDPSTIAGTLGSNGRLVLVNPSGIAVAPGAVVDTSGFTATTLGMSRSDAIAGRLAFGGKDSDHDFKTKSGTGRVEVRGQVLARNGDVVLIGPDLEVDAGAILEADAGDVVLAAGRTVEVTGRGLEGIVMQLRAPDDRAVNLGTLRGDSVAIFAGQLRHSGVVQAHSASTLGSRVVLQATDEAEIAGSIVADTLAHGGSVLVTGDKLTLKSQAAIDVSHAAGGGEILVGGGWQGQDTRLTNASQVQVEQGVLLKADATLQGNGGTVVVWSTQSTRYAGTILARGAGGGVGGRVEVSGARGMEVGGTVDVIGLAATPVGPGGSSKGSSGGSDSAGSSGSNSSGSSDAGKGSGGGDGKANGDLAGAGSGKSADSGSNGAKSGDSGKSGDTGSNSGKGSGKGSGSSGGSDTADNNGKGSSNSGSGNSGSGSGDAGRVAGNDSRGDSGRDDRGGPRRAPGHPFEPGTVTAVALVPRDAQPEVVQAAVREPAAATQSYIGTTSAKLDAPTAAADGDDAPLRKIVVSETRCAVVTR